MHKRILIKREVEERTTAIQIDRTRYKPKVKVGVIRWAPRYRSGIVTKGEIGEAGRGLEEEREPAEEVSGVSIAKNGIIS